MTTRNSVFFSSVFDVTTSLLHLQIKNREKKNKTLFLVRLNKVSFFLQFLASEKLKSFVKIINEGLRKSWVREKPAIYIPA